MPDPLDRLESAVDSLTRLADSDAARTRYEAGNRQGLLWVHAVIGMLAGFQMLLFGSATIIEDAVGVWTRPVMAALGMVGGIILALGLVQRPRSIVLEAIGLAVVGVWDALMTAGLGFARWQQGEFAVIPLGTPLVDGYVTAYPVTVYGGLLALIVIHLWTLRRLRKARL